MATFTKWRILMVVACCVIYLNLVSPSQDVMKKMTAGFAQALEECKNELNIGDHIMADFYNFWREEYDLVHKDMGCAIICMASKFDLVTEDLSVHHGKAHEFAKRHGADDDMAKKLVEIIHDCEKTHAGITDDCSRALEIAKCFRTRIHELKWAPPMEVILEEVMTEV